MKLNRSIPDTIALGAAVEERFIGLCETYRRIKGVDLVPPMELRSDFLLWRTMVSRHRNGDYRNTEDELKSTQTVATWTVQVNCAIRNQPPKHVVWREEVGI